MNKLSTTAVAAAISLALGGAALAQEQSRQAGQYQSFESSEHGQRASEEMRSLDTNRDDRVDQSEAQSDPELVAAWADIDVDQDGSINATEYYLYAAQQRIAQLEGGSAGQQGAQQRSAEQRGAQQRSAEQQSEQEARDGEFGRQAEQQQARGQQQAGDDQRLGQQDEQRQARDQQQPGQQRQSRDAQIGEDDERQARDSALGRQGDQQAGGAGQHPSFEEVDENSDGRLSRTEVALIEGVDFTTADENQDGYVSRSEYMQATEQQQ